MMKSIFLGAIVVTGFMLGYSADAATIASSSVDASEVGGLILLGVGLTGLITHRRVQRMK